jgi:hypothetical protein
MKDCVDSERVPQDKASALVRLATRGRQSSTGSKQLKILMRNVIMCRVLSSRSPECTLKRLVLGPKLHRRRPQKSSKRINPGVLEKDSCGNNLRKRPAIQLTAGLYNSPPLIPPLMRSNRHQNRVVDGSRLLPTERPGLPHKTS